MTDLRRLRDLGSAHLLVPCPRCGSSCGIQCRTDSGFYGGASGPHAARKRAIAHMSEADIIAGWDARRREQEAARVERDAAEKPRHSTWIVGPNADGLYGYECKCSETAGPFYQPSYAIDSAGKHGPLTDDSQRPADTYDQDIRAQVSGPDENGLYSQACPVLICEAPPLQREVCRGTTEHDSDEDALRAAYDHRRIFHRQLHHKRP